MSYSVTTAKAELAAVLHGTTLNKIQALDQMFDRAARQLVADIDPQETKRILLSSTPIYNQIYDYSVPVDLKGNKIIDIYPQYLRTRGSVLSQTTNQSFDVAKNAYPLQGDFTIVFNTGLKFIRINDPNTPVGVLIDPADTTYQWTVGGTASDLVVNNVNFVSGSGSLQCDMAAGANPSTGYYELDLNTAIDLSDQVDQSSLFYFLYFPTGSQIVSTEIRWGSDSSNYYSRTLTTTQEGTAIATAWNLFRADWLGATVTGSPDASNITYVRVSVNYTGQAQTGILLDNIVSTMGLYRNIEYYSKYLFRDASTGAFQETVTDDSNLINLDTDSYNLYLFLVAYYAMQQVQGADAIQDASFFWNEYQRSKLKYTSQYKSEIQKPQDVYYRMTKGGYGGFLGRRY